jgi:chromosome segregation protein
MVYITKLTLKGFKSFPQRPVTVPFEKNFNVITGPNGSGKSNIMDALRFVLGENSPKALRHNKMSDLVHDQSADENAFARVSATLDNTDRAIPVDEDKVLITRELKRNGDSQYFMNSRKLSRNQYLEILSAAHISYDGLNIIAQGTIQRLAELTPDEKRGAVEQYLGLKHFDEKKAEAMARLREADSELAISFAKLDERREAIERLQAERNDALRYRHLQHEMARIRKAILRREVDILERQIEEDRAKLQELAVLKQEYEQNIGKMYEEKRMLEQNRDQYYNEKIAGPNKRLTEIGLSLAQLNSEILSLRKTKDELSSLKSTLDEAIPRLNNMLSAAESEKDSLLKHIEDLRSRIEEKNGLVRQSMENAAKLQSERESVRNEILRLSKKDDALKSRISLLEERMNRQREALRTATERLSQKRSELEEAVSKETDLLNMTHTFLEKVSELGRSLPQLNEEAKKLEGQVSTIKETRRRLSREISQAETILNESFQTVAKYASGRELAERFLGEELNVAKIEELAQSGAIDGFNGTLSSIIKYDKRYSAAVRASGQDWLYAFVVDNITNLLQLASLAKKLHTGRVRILPLSELRGVPSGVAPAEPGVLGLVSDFVQCNERFRPAVDFVFGNTLLVSSAKTAYILSQKGYRCITPLGDLFEPKTAALETGKVSELTLKEIGLSDAESIRVAEESLAALKESLARRKQGLERLEKAQAELEEKRFTLLVEIRKEESNLKTYSSFVNRYNSLAARATRRVAQIKNQIVQLEKGIERYNKRIIKLESIIQIIQGRRVALGIDKLRERDSEIEAEIARISATVDSLSRDISTMNAEISGFEATLNGQILPRVSQIKQSLENSQKELGEAMGQLPTIDARLMELEAAYTRLQEEEKVVREEDEMALPRLREMEEQIKGKEEEINSERQRILRVEKDSLKVESAMNSRIGQKQSLENEIALSPVREDVYFTEGLEQLLEDIRAEEEELKDRVNLLAPQTYAEAFINYRNASERRNELERDRNAIVSFVEKVEAEKKAAFMKAYEQLDKEIRNVFSVLTGGEAWLELENPDDPFSGGIFLIAKFPKGAPRESSSLSGGEKAIVAVAFLLAFQTIYPSGFYLLDEVDAALDPIYAQGLGRMLADWSSRAQIIVISLKESVVNKSSNVLGVYMTAGSSNVVRLKREVQVDVRPQ